MSIRTLVLVAVAVLLTIASSRTAVPVDGSAALIFQTNMYGDEQVPPVETVAWGFVRFFFNEDRSEADYTVDVKSLSNTLVAGADIHRGAPGENGPVIRHLTDGNFIVTGGHMTLTAAERAEMASGNWYVSLKTYANPEGELRGQIVVPGNFLPEPATPTPTPAALVRADANPPAPATSSGGTGGPTIKPPNTGDAGLADPPAASGGLVLAAAALAGLSAFDLSARRLRALAPRRAGRRPRRD